MLYNKSEYIYFNPFEGDFGDGERTLKVKVVKVRKPHLCSFDYKHTIPVGSFARYEVCVESGGIACYYHCTECIDKFLAERGE